MGHPLENTHFSILYDTLFHRHTGPQHSTQEASTFIIQMEQSGNTTPSSPTYTPVAKKGRMELGHVIDLSVDQNNVIDLSSDNEQDSPPSTATLAHPLHPFHHLLGKYIMAPHKFFYKVNVIGNGKPCPISVPEMFGKVVELPAEENEECFRIEWLGLYRDGPYSDIPKVLQPYLCPLFQAKKYGAYIQDLVEFTELLHQDKQMACVRVMFRLRPTSPSTDSGDSISNSKYD